MKFWIDTDNALGAERGDVDDGFALAAVLAAQRNSHDESTNARSVKLLGVSAIKGNTDASTAFHCNQELLRVAECSDVSCVQAVDAAETIAAVPDNTSILAIGPLTNIAGALRIDRELLERTSVRIVATVNNRRRHPILPRFCLNVRHDPDAASAVFAAGRACKSDAIAKCANGLRVIPLDVALRLRVSVRRLEELETRGALATHLALHSRRWLKQSWWRYQSLSFPAWDLLAALDALDAVDRARSDGRVLVDFAPEATWARFVASLT